MIIYERKSKVSNPFSPLVLFIGLAMVVFVELLLLIEASKHPKYLDLNHHATEIKRKLHRCIILKSNSGPSFARGR